MHAPALAIPRSSQRTASECPPGCSNASAATCIYKPSKAPSNNGTGVACETNNKQGQEEAASALAAQAHTARTETTLGPSPVERNGRLHTRQSDATNPTERTPSHWKVSRPRWDMARPLPVKKWLRRGCSGTVRAHGACGSPMRFDHHVALGSWKGRAPRKGGQEASDCTLRLGARNKMCRKLARVSLGSVGQLPSRAGVKVGGGQGTHSDCGHKVEPTRLALASCCSKKRCNVTPHIPDKAFMLERGATYTAGARVLWGGCPSCV